MTYNDVLDSLLDNVESKRWSTCIGLIDQLRTLTPDEDSAALVSEEDGDDDDSIALAVEEDDLDMVSAWGDDSDGNVMW